MARVADLATWRADRLIKQHLITLAKLRAVDPIAADVIEDYTADLATRVRRGESLAELTEATVEAELTRRITARRGTSPDDVA